MSFLQQLAKMKSSSSGHVVGVPVTSKVYGIEEKASSARDGQSFRKADGDHLAVSLTHPSPYTSFGYKHSKSRSCMHGHIVQSDFRCMHARAKITRLMLIKLCFNSAGSKGQVVHWVSKLSRRAQGFREHGE